MVEVRELVESFESDFEIVVTVQSDESTILSILHLEGESLACRHLLLAWRTPRIPEVQK